MSTGVRGGPFQLMEVGPNPRGAGFLHRPRHPITGTSPTIGAQRQLKSLHAGLEGNYTNLLNTALLGGTSYPILEAVLGTGIGFVFGGAALLFTVGTVGLSLSRTSHRVLARSGDQLWQVEQIGHYNGNTVHVSGYFLFDPFRNGSFRGGNGWLIHEQRQVLDV